MNTYTQRSPSLQHLPDGNRQVGQPAADTARQAVEHASHVAKEDAQRISKAAKDAGQQIADTAKGVGQQVTDRAKEIGQQITDTAKETGQKITATVEDTVTRTKEYVSQNPVPAVLGAVAFGAALGCLMMMRRQKPTFGNRYVDEPLNSAREAIFAILAPVAKRLHEGYDSARDGAGKTLDKVHDFHPSRTVNSWSDQLGRLGSSLKFW